MSGSNSENTSGFLKRTYGGDSKTFQQNLEGKFYKEIETSPDKPNGEGFFSMSFIRGNEAGGAFNEDERTKDPQNPEPIQPRILPKNIHWPIQFTGRFKALSESNSAAFFDALDGNIIDAQARWVSDTNRQCFGNGFGTLTQVNGAVPASTSVVVDSVQYLRVNMVIDGFDTIGGTKEINARKITAIDVDTNTITLDLAVTCSDNAVLVKEGMLDNPGTEGKELSGLARIVDTTVSGTTFQGISRSTYPEYRSNVVDANNVPVSQDLLQQLIDRIEIASGETPNLILSRQGVRRSWIGQAITQTRYQDDSLKTGAVNLTWAGLKWMTDKDCQTNTIYMLNTKPKYLAKYMLKDVHLADADGKEINKVQGFDKYYAYFIGYLNLGSQRPNAHGKIIKLTEPTF